MKFNKEWQHGLWIIEINATHIHNNVKIGGLLVKNNKNLDQLISETIEYLKSDTCEFYHPCRSVEKHHECVIKKGKCAKKTPLYLYVTELNLVFSTRRFNILNLHQKKPFIF